MGQIAIVIASTLFAGFIPRIVSQEATFKGGGLFGSLAGAAVMCWAYLAAVQLATIFWIIGLTFALGLIFIGPAERYWIKEHGAEPRHNGKMAIRDLNWVCLDEFHGVAIASLPLFLTYGGQRLGGVVGWPGLIFLLIGLALFRIFDVFKVWPSSWVERKWSNSFGIMFDDTVAGLQAGLVLFLLVCPSHVLRNLLSALF